ncbi:hypothetical protein [Antribacter gilvus]|uniref:hypothetical protein n=1 Tax=Antribacter gilvus TaxID=2304675 RepID=UPI000F7B4A02|nr:hypothetical protein [Antribacter gilvus]
MPTADNGLVCAVVELGAQAAGLVLDGQDAAPVFVVEVLREEHRVGGDGLPACDLGSDVLTDLVGAQSLGERLQLLDEAGGHAGRSAAPCCDGVDELVEVLQRVGPERVPDVEPIGAGAPHRVSDLAAGYLVPPLGLERQVGARPLQPGDLPLPPGRWRLVPSAAAQLFSGPPFTAGGVGRLVEIQNDCVIHRLPLPP